MEAKYTILTHFSQRYSKIPIFDEIEEPGTERVGVAFDNMTVRPHQFCLIRHTFPVLKELFYEELGEIETKKSHFTTRDFAKTIVENLAKDNKRSFSSDEKEKVKTKKACVDS